MQAVSETPVQPMSCSICQSFEHLVEECPRIPAVREMFGDQANVIGQFKPITMLHIATPTMQIGGTIRISPGNRGHLNTRKLAKHLSMLQILNKPLLILARSWEIFFGDQKSINAQLSQRINSVETTLNKRMDGMQNDLSQKIDNLQYSTSRLTNLNTVQEKGRFPSQPHQNPKAIHKVEAEEGESSQVREVKAVITLRSGKEVDLPTTKPEPEQER